MTREEKCQLAIEKGYIYNPETGDVISRYNKTIKTKHSHGYIHICMYDENKKLFNLKAHQFAWYWVNKKCVTCIDHINGIKDDNRICNLRNITQQENMWNQPKAKGYNWSKKAKKWEAKIAINNKRIYLGCFDKEEDARAAYLEAKQKYHIINS